MANADNTSIRIVIIVLAALGALGLLAIPVWLATLRVSGGENPTWLPLENYGITEYQILDSDLSNSNGLRAAGPTASQGDASSLEDFRSIARSIKQDSEYRDLDYISILFIERLSGTPPKFDVAVALTDLGQTQVQNISGQPVSGSKNGDGVYLYAFP